MVKDDVEFLYGYPHVLCGSLDYAGICLMGHEYVYVSGSEPRALKSLPHSVGESLGGKAVNGLAVLYDDVFRSTGVYAVIGDMGTFVLKGVESAGVFGIYAPEPCRIRAVPGGEETVGIRNDRCPCAVPEEDA